jgi:hypothetical protein
MVLLTGFTPHEQLYLYVTSARMSYSVLKLNVSEIKVFKFNSLPILTYLSFKSFILLIRFL